MKTFRCSWAIAALALLRISSVFASPAVDVAVRASFGAPPYLVELLETAAEENSTSYLPLLDRIAEGYFDAEATDEALFHAFVKLLKDDGHTVEPEALSTFQLALSIHSAAPRIEAHYQYYNTSVEPKLPDGSEEQDCETWVYLPAQAKRYCSPELAESSGRSFGEADNRLLQLPFDRVLGDLANGQPSVLYADIISPSFRKFHQTVSKTAKAGKTSYRVRYKPSRRDEKRPLTVSGYGVELALKRTDYIVIDDRQDGEAADDGSKESVEATLDSEEVADLKPLSSSELLRLGVKAASFVMNSQDQLDTLLRLSQDFPKHSGAIAATNTSNDFLTEHIKNRDLLLPPGYNVLWINGVQMMARDIDAYALLEHLRRERKMIGSVRELGLSGQEAISLLSHKAITEAQIDQEPQRYDWRDHLEGGDVILWLNDIEKDKRYEEWTSSINGFLQRTYPGQLPPVRKEAHNLIVPVDFSEYSDVSLVVENLQNFVKRKVPIRFGLVPRFQSPAAVEQALVVYHLMDTYGLSATLTYLEKSIAGAGRKFGPPVQSYFEKAVEGRKLRKDHTVMTLQEVVTSKTLRARLTDAQNYLARLGATDIKPPILVNGVPVPHADDWLQMMSNRVSMDSRLIQQAVFEETLTQDSYLPELFLAKAASRRNPLIVPEDEKTLRYITIGDTPGLEDLPSVTADESTIERELVHLLLVADFDSPEGFELLLESLLFRTEHDNVEIATLHVPHDKKPLPRLSAALQGGLLKDVLSKLGTGDQEQPGGNEDEAPAERKRSNFRSTMYSLILQWKVDEDASRQFWSSKADIDQGVGIQIDQKAMVLNGRIVGPMSAAASIRDHDLESLLSYERKTRLLPASAAIKDLSLEDKSSTPLAFARISNLIALSTISDVPEGIFEAAPTARTDIFSQWNSSKTAIKVGDIESANIQIVASIDPASETAQRWIPILKVISELDGVYTCLFLNPRERLEELPVKRFYRHVLESKPKFAADGSLRGLSAHFSGLPAEALLNIGMDLPPSWLVAPEESIHDLDNIKLSAVKTQTDIEAIYELEHILIEGHSRDVTLGPPPRGAQLVLGTERDTHFADTIIMANLGYFQFKANPGFYNLTLQKGRSEEIFQIDSAGSQGYNKQPSDESTEIALMSFRGTTLFPRLSRKPGMEEEDVLEPAKTAVDGLTTQADAILSQVGLSNVKTGKYLSKAMNMFSTPSPRTPDAAHADINIFSVASGHLYERMLNIMMLSVMKHTKHSVKFWFIEQFLSPSFKSFLPTMAAEYNFRYEMVTYKWPHWLRGQKEKQREIWGYKILFLDVLFPLDLDKVIFVDADQIVRTDMHELVTHDLQGAPYGFTPMCDSRTEMEGFRFWKQGYWKNFLRGLPYHISALYVVDLRRFRAIAAGDRLRQQYHQLSADPASLSNLDQDLPNHMQMVLPIHSLPQEWLWCETWCSDESLAQARTIDLCNNPLTKEPKLERARRQVPEWTVYDDEVAALARRKAGEGVVKGKQDEAESVQEQLQYEDAAAAEEKTRLVPPARDEL